MHALKYAFMSLKIGDKRKAVATGSERLAITMTSDNYKEEVQKLGELEKNPHIGFEKDFLRWMLSDGAGAFMLETEKNPDALSLRIDWIEASSFANKLDPCMYMGGDKVENGQFQSYKDFEAGELVTKSLMSIKQDVKLLGDNIVLLGVQLLGTALRKHQVNVEEITYFLPHISSHFFKQPLAEILETEGLHIPEEKWFTNLDTKGNVGAASIYLMVEELLNGGKLKAGDRVLLLVPESARFSYAVTWLTVC
jgi:3-oxoacyl-[acyl-carrier-protein] synthase-3